VGHDVFEVLFFLTIRSGCFMKKIYRHLSLVALTTTALTALPALAFETGDVVIQAGVTNVEPCEDSKEVTVNGVGVASGLGVDSSTQLGLTLEYFFSERWGMELLAAIPFEHDASTTGALSGLGKIVEAKQLPPTLSAVYHFIHGKHCRPYLGLGINYTAFFSEDLVGNGVGAFPGGDVSLDDSWGISVQAGMDMMLNDNILLNASVRWIDIDTEAKIKFAGNVVAADIEIDPYVYTISVGYRF